MVSVLVDLANSDVARVNNPNPRLLASRLDASLERFAETILAGRAGIPELHFRLYDGWFDEAGQATDLYGMLLPHVRSEYPRRRRKYRAFVEMADSLLAAPRTKLMGTTRRGSGFGQHRLKVGSSSGPGCQNQGNCAIDSLASWVKGRCPHAIACAASVDDIVSYKYQKLVDTALVADAVWLGSQQQEVVIVSNDEDVVPGLVTARSLGSAATWLVMNVPLRTLYKALIVDYRVGHAIC